MQVFRSLFILIFLCSCRQKTQSDFQARSRLITAELIASLQQIDDLDSLIEAQRRLQCHFDALVDVMIEARKWQMKTKASWVLSEEDHQQSRQLACELNRLLRNPLARHFLEKAQNPALERLDAFEKRKIARNSPFGS